MTKTTFDFLENSKKEQMNMIQHFISVQIHHFQLNTTKSWYCILYNLNIHKGKSSLPLGFFSGKWIFSELLWKEKAKNKWCIWAFSHQFVPCWTAHLLQPSSCTHLGISHQDADECLQFALYKRQLQVQQTSVLSPVNYKGHKMLCFPPRMQPKKVVILP